MKLLLVLTVLGAISEAVDIRIWRNRGCRGNGVMCGDAPAGGCCRFQNSGLMQSAGFSKIRQNSLTAVYQRTVCGGQVQGIGRGPGCVNGLGRSAVWVPQGGRSSRSQHFERDVRSDLAYLEEHECDTEVLADTAIIGGRYFNMSEGVPSDIRERLALAVVEDDDIDNVPDYLFRYEI